MGVLKKMNRLVLFALLALVSTSAVASDKETVYDRVMRTGTLRCGYYLFAPISEKDPATGKLSGIAIDLMEAIGKKADLKIDWAEEVSFGTMHAGLQAGRYDAICTPDWPDSRNGKIATFTHPILFAAVNAYVRADDTRFDSNLSKINDPAIKISIQDGSVEEQIARTQFPKAQTVSIPQMSDSTQLELDVAGRKADVAFIDANRAEQFLAKNPGTLKRINKNPIQVFPFKIPVLADETRLRDYLNVVLEDISNSGELDRILDRHIKKQGLFLRVSKPYQAE